MKDAVAVGFIFGFALAAVLFYGVGSNDCVYNQPTAQESGGRP